MKIQREMEAMFDERIRDGMFYYTRKYFSVFPLLLCSGVSMVGKGHLGEFNGLHALMALILAFFMRCVFIAKLRQMDMTG